MKNLLILFALLLPSLSWGDGNIDTQLRLHYERQQEQIRAQRDFANTLADTINRQEMRKAELAAVEFFKDGVTAEKVVIFNKLYPIMSIPSIIELAKAIDTVRRLNAKPKALTPEETDKIYKEMAELINEVMVKPTKGMTPQERKEFLDRQQKEFNRYIDNYYGIGR